MYKSIIDEPLQNQLVNEFFDSRWFGEQHWYAARAEILALKEKVDAQAEEIKVLKSNGNAAKGSAQSDKTDKVKKEK